MLAEGLKRSVIPDISNSNLLVVGESMGCETMSKMLGFLEGLFKHCAYSVEKLRALHVEGVCNVSSQAVITRLQEMQNDLEMESSKSSEREGLSVGEIVEELKWMVHTHSDFARNGVILNFVKETTLSCVADIILSMNTEFNMDKRKEMKKLGKLGKRAHVSKEQLLKELKKTMCNF